MKPFLDRLAKLIDVRSITTLSMVIGFLFLTFTGIIQAEMFMTMFSLVIGFYFSKEAKKESK